MTVRRCIRHIRTIHTMPHAHRARTIAFRLCKTKSCCCSIVSRETHETQTCHTVSTDPNESQVDADVMRKDDENDANSHNLGEGLVACRLDQFQSAVSPRAPQCVGSTD